MIAKLRILVFFLSLLGLSLTSCQKEELYTPGGPDVTLDGGKAGNSVQSTRDSGDVIIDPDGGDDDDDENDDEHSNEIKD